MILNFFNRKKPNGTKPFVGGSLPLCTARKMADEIYRKMNSYCYPSQMNGIDREWIIEKIVEGLMKVGRQ